MDLRDLDGSRRSWRSPLYDGVCLSEKYSVSYFLCKLTFLFDEPFFIFTCVGAASLGRDFSTSRVISSLNLLSISLTRASIYSIHTFKRS